MERSTAQIGQLVERPTRRTGRANDPAYATKCSALLTKSLLYRECAAIICKVLVRISVIHVAPYQHLRPCSARRPGRSLLS